MDPEAPNKRRRGGDYVAATAAGVDGATIARMEARLEAMQDQIDRLVEANNSLKAEMEALKGEGSSKAEGTLVAWEYSAPAIPDSYWRHLGFGDNYIREMQQFLYRLRRDTMCLRGYGMAPRDIRLGCGPAPEEALIVNQYGGSLPDVAPWTVIQYDTMLRQHWKEFIGALQSLQGLDRGLYIYNIQLPYGLLRELESALKGKRFTEICLDNVTLSSAFRPDMAQPVDSPQRSVMFAVALIEGMDSLRTFSWRNVQIKSAEDANTLLAAITSHPHVDSVCFNNCFGDHVDGYDMLRLLLASNKMEKINFERNELWTAGGSEIAEFIAANPCTEELYLAGNCLDDDDLAMIGNALKSNTNLKRISVLGSDTTGAGCSALERGFYDTGTLNSAFNSNHTCQLIRRPSPPGMQTYLPTEEDFRFNHPSASEIPRTLRGIKMYHMLSSRNRDGSNAHHLDLEVNGSAAICEAKKLHGGDDLKLVPWVLSSVFNYWLYKPRIFDDSSAIAVYPLSIVYEITRAWKMPSLFERSNG